jgi:hypothetical protein
MCNGSRDISTSNPKIGKQSPTGSKKRKNSELNWENRCQLIPGRKEHH